MLDWDKDKCLTFRAEFTLSVEDDGSYVTERTSMDKTATKFGPMKAEQVDQLIAERRRYWGSMLEREKLRFIPTGVES